MQHLQKIRNKEANANEENLSEMLISIEKKY